MNNKKPKKQNPNKEILVFDGDLDFFLMQQNQLFLTGALEDDISENLCKKLLTTSLTKKDSNIILWINSPGGIVQNGFAIIDMIKIIGNNLITINFGEAASMAGLISIVGHKRFITENAFWMFHDLAGGAVGSPKTIRDHAKMAETLQKKVVNVLKTHTKLTNKEIQEGLKGELWLDAKQCLAKGIVDDILGIPKKEKGKKNEVSK